MVSGSLLPTPPAIHRMHRYPYPVLAVALVVALLVASVPLALVANGQDPAAHRAPGESENAPADNAGLTQADEAARAELARQIEARLTALHAARQQRLAESARQQAQLATINERVARLQRELAEATAQRDELDAACHTLDQRHAGLTADIASRRQLIADLAARVQPVVVRFRQRVVAGVAWHRGARLDALDQIATLLAGSDTLMQADGLCRFLDVARSDLIAAGEIHRDNQAVPVDADRIVHAWVLRVGLVGEWYVAEDGDTVGYTLTGDNGEWTRVDTTDPQRASIVTALDTAAGKSPPAFIQLRLRAGGTAESADFTGGSDNR